MKAPVSAMKVPEDFAQTRRGRGEEGRVDAQPSLQRQ